MKILVEHIEITPESFRDPSGSLNSNTLEKVCYNLTHTGELLNVKADYVNFCYSYDVPIKEGYVADSKNLRYIEV